MGFITKNRKQAAAIAAVLLLFIVFSVFRFASIHWSGTAETDAEETGQSELTDAEIAASEAEECLSSEQIALRDSYSDETLTFIGLLCSSDWMVGDHLPSLSFTPECYTETNEDMEQSVNAYVVSDIRVDSPQSGGTYSETYTAVLETGSGQSCLVQLTGTKDAETGASTFALSSSLFLRSWESYSPAATQKEFFVEGLNTDIQNYLGDGVETLKSELKSYCASYVPTASTATWDNGLYIDYSEGNLTTYFTLDDQAQTALTVTFDMDDKSFTVTQ